MTSATPSPRDPVIDRDPRPPAPRPSPPWLGLIGVVHLGALPGDPRYVGGGVARVERAALADAERLVEGGADAIIVENFGSAPFARGNAADPAPPHQVAALARIALRIRERCEVPIGVNCLRNDARAALGIACACELDMIRVNVHTGAYVTDQGLIEGDAGATLRYRRALEQEQVAILADVLVKHASPLAPLDAADATRDALDRGLADAVIVTGAATGHGVDRERLARVREAAGPDRLVLLGSGVTPESAPLLAPLADGAIVGTWLKEEGRIDRPVDPARVRALAEVLREHLRRAP